jgi:hypothetical protein
MLTRLLKKLAFLRGGLAILSDSAIATPSNTPALPVRNTDAASPGSSAKPLPPKLVLKQTRTGFRMIAQHDSHSSHSSHSSHASHSSHSSGGFA